MAVIAPTEENFKKMLQTDEQVFKQLVTVKVWLDRNIYHRNWAATKTVYDTELAKYTKRQNDYANNKLYSISRSIQQTTNQAVAKFADFFRFVPGLGAVPLLVPVAVVAGATISVVAIAYFVNAYYTETNTGFAALIKLLPEIQKSDPALASQIVNAVAAQEKVEAKAEAESGFWQQLGKGGKIAIGFVGAAAGAALFYGVGKKYQWF